MESVERYLLRRLVNLHSRDSPESALLSSEIEGLRNRIREIFSWDGGIALLPNAYYAKRTVLENFRGRRIFADGPFTSPAEEFNVEPLSNLESLEGGEPSLLLLRGPVGKRPRGECYAFTELVGNERDPGSADAFLHCPVDGVAILGFRGRLEPFYLGSNSLSRLDRESFGAAEDSASALECGTGNYPLFLFLIDFWASNN